MISYCVFVAGVPLAFFFLLLFLPLQPILVWMACFCIFRGAVKLPPTSIWSLTVPTWSFLALVGVRFLAVWVCVMAMFFAVGLMVRALLPSALLIRAATAWAHGLRSQAATSPQGHGVPLLRLLRLHLPGAPLVVMLWWSALV